MCESRIVLINQGMQYLNLEEILVLTANGKTYTSQFEAVCEFYGEDLDKALLSAQLLSLDSLLIFFVI